MSQGGRFWRDKPLAGLSGAEWEALCDGCGLCCLEKYLDHDGRTVLYTSVACQYLDLSDCRCLVYPHRLRLNPECTRLSAADLPRLTWLPDSCAYRRVAEGRPLPDWHHLVCGDRAEVHRRGCSAAGRAVSGISVHPGDRTAAVLARRAPR